MNTIIAREDGPVLADDAAFGPGTAIVPPLSLNSLGIEVFPNSRLGSLAMANAMPAHRQCHGSIDKDPLARGIAALK